MIVWALVDDKIGSNNQTISIAESLSKNCVIKKIVYNSFIKLPNFIRNSSLIGVNKKDSDNIIDNLPDVVICAGRRLSSIALNIKKRSKGKTFVINILNPNLSFKKFDLIILPKHDNTSKKYLKNNDIIETNGSLSRANKDKITEETKKWKDYFKNYKRPLISLIIGGDTKDFKFDSIEFGKMISNLSNIVNKMMGTLLITTSRRTSDECLNELNKKLNCDNYLYDWKKENDLNNQNKNLLGNPYFAFLGLSNFLVVTGDSMSMVSEACSTGKPTYVYIPKKSLSKKHMRFNKTMIEDGYIKEFNKNNENLIEYKYEPLNELTKVMNIINKKLKEKK